MSDSSLLELSRVISLIVETNNGIDAHFLEDGDVIFRSEIGALYESKSTPRSSLGLSYGELRAINLLGIIQFISPFYIF